MLERLVDCYLIEYSNADFFQCLSDGNDLNISWTLPQGFSTNTPLQVEYQCYDESLPGNSTVVNYVSFMYKRNFSFNG